MNKPAFSRAWRMRCATKRAAVERAALKRERSRRGRHEAKNAMAVGFDPPAYPRLNAWDVI